MPYAYVITKYWYVTVTQLVSCNQVSNSWYEWRNERALVLSHQKNKDVPGYSATYKENTKYAGQLDCERANEKEK